MLQYSNLFLRLYLSSDMIYFERSLIMLIDVMPYTWITWILDNLERSLKSVIILPVVARIYVTRVVMVRSTLYNNLVFYVQNELPRDLD